jgi:hypothetical protein
MWTARGRTLALGAAAQPDVLGEIQLLAGCQHKPMPSKSSRLFFIRCLRGRGCGVNSTRQSETVAEDQAPPDHQRTTRRSVEDLAASKPAMAEQSPPHAQTSRSRCRGAYPMHARDATAHPATDVRVCPGHPRLREGPEAGGQPWMSHKAERLGGLQCVASYTRRLWWQPAGDTG